MGINWIVTQASRGSRSDADLEVYFSKGKQSNYRFNFSKGAHATKLHNAQRILIGMNEEETRMYFAPAEGRLGYKVVSKPNGTTALVYVSNAKMEQTFPTLPPSAVVGTYDLKLDEREKLYYISIGALPR